jgi:hypothetical protein
VQQVRASTASTSSPLTLSCSSERHRRHLLDGVPKQSQNYRLVTGREGNTIQLQRGGLLMAETFETYEQFLQWLAKGAARGSAQAAGRGARPRHAP